MRAETADIQAGGLRAGNIAGGRTAHKKALRRGNPQTFHECAEESRVGLRRSNLFGNHNRTERDPQTFDSWPLHERKPVRGNSQRIAACPLLQQPLSSGQRRRLPVQ